MKRPRLRNLQPFYSPDAESAARVREVAKGTHGYTVGGYDVTRRARSEVMSLVKLNKGAGVRTGWEAVRWFRRLGMAKRVREVIDVLGGNLGWEKEEALCMAETKGDLSVVKGKISRLLLKNVKFTVSEAVILAVYLSQKQRYEGVGVGRLLSVTTALNWELPKTPQSTSLVASTIENVEEFFTEETEVLHLPIAVLHAVAKNTRDYATIAILSGFDKIGDEKLMVALTGHSDHIISHLLQQYYTTGSHPARMYYISALYRRPELAVAMSRGVTESSLHGVEGLLGAYSGAGMVKECFAAYKNRGMTKVTIQMVWRLLEAVVTARLWSCKELEEAVEVYKVIDSVGLGGFVIGRAVTTHGMVLRAGHVERWGLVEKIVKEKVGGDFPPILMEEHLTACVLEGTSTLPHVLYLYETHPNLRTLFAAPFIALHHPPPLPAIFTSTTLPTYPYLIPALSYIIESKTPPPPSFFESRFISNLVLSPNPSHTPPMTFPSVEALLIYLSSATRSGKIPALQACQMGWEALVNYCEETEDYESILQDGGAAVLAWVGMGGV